MRYLILLLLTLSLTLTSCNDGDIITIDLEFDKELSQCGDLNSANGNITNDNYVIYDIKPDPYESLTLLFPVNTNNNLIFNPETSPHEGSFNINNTTVRFNYRTYDGDPSGLICQDIPSSDINITNDYAAVSGTVNYSSSFVDEDGTRTVTVVFTITNSDLEILNQDVIELGTYTVSFSI